MTIDPFAPAAADNASIDPFADPSRGGNFPKVSELLHKLLIMIPVKVEEVPDKNNPGKMVERWSVDTTVLHEDGTFDTYNAMYWSQAGIASECRKVHKSGKPIRGTLHLFPVRSSKDNYAGEKELLEDEDIQRWLARGKGLAPTPVAWGLEPATPEESKRSIAWWQENMNPFNK